MLRKIKELNNSDSAITVNDNGKSHYGQWTRSRDTTWMDGELMMDWLMDDCFPLFYLLTYLYIGKIPENFPHSIFPEK